ncbi:acyltransferase family protein [Edaphobacter sp.]|nr:acyltransferase [Edaphobacter sp.]
MPTSSKSTTLSPSMNHEETSQKKQVPVRPKSGYIKTLDGWRTIAVGAVILYHARGITIGGANFSKLQNFGDRGVQLFFAISGILICSRLLEEQRMHGHISLRGFYIRRVFRIQPAAIVFLATVGILAIVGTLHPTLPASLSSLFCYRNFYEAANGVTSPDDRYTTHFWSLAVEEHFYLLLPSLLIFGRKKIIPLLTALSVIFFLWPPIAHHFKIFDSPLAAWRTDMALRDLLVPALLAVLLTKPAFRTWMTKISSRNALILLTIVALLLSQFLLKGHLMGEMTCIGFPLMVISTMLHPEGWIGRLLETRPFLFIGRISYSLYLWQELFFLHRKDDSSLRFLQSAPWNLIAVLVCAILSYYVVERPLMRLGHRLAPPATPGRNDLGNVSVS